MSHLTPYEILQLDETATMSEIKHRYRNLIKYIHPDKKRMKSNVPYIDNLSDIERRTLFEHVQKAYKELKAHKGREDDMPFDNIEYNIQEQLKINDNIGSSLNGFSKHELKNFNSEFEHYKKNKQDDGDPQNMGYASFNHENIQTFYKDIKTKSKQKFNDRLSGNNFHLGLTVIDDYSVNIGHKQGLYGSDLGIVYNDTKFSRINENGDKSLSKKEFQKKIKEKIKERKKIDKQIENDSIYLSEEENLKKLKKVYKEDNERRKIQKKRDKINTIRRINI